jgi:hypothetical protein
LDYLADTTVRDRRIEGSFMDVFIYGWRGA